MSSFCTSCGAAATSSSFCTSCGNPMGSSIAAPATPLAQNVESPFLEQSAGDVKESSLPEESKPLSKKKYLVLGLAVVLFVGIGLGGFFAGKASIDLKKERKIAYDEGYKVGDDSGFSRGNSSGYDRGYDAGKTAGCLDVFSFSDGTFDHMIPYNPDSFYNKYPGSYYTSKSSC